MTFPLLPAPRVKPVVGTDVGIPTGYGSLTTQGFTTIRDPGTTVEGINFTDGLTIDYDDPTAPPVVVRHNLWDGVSDGGAGPAIHVAAGSRAIIYGNEVVGEQYAVAIEGPGRYIAHRNFLHDLAVDAYKVGQGCWIFRNLVDGLVWPGGDPHQDGAQAQDTIRASSVITGDWWRLVNRDGEWSSAGAFSNPNFPTAGTDLGVFAVVGVHIEGSGIPIYAAMGSLGDTGRHFFFASRIVVKAGSYQYDEPVVLGNGPDEPTHIVHDNTLDDGTPITVETTNRAELSRSGDDLILAFTAGGTGTLNLGQIPAELDAESEGTPDMAFTTAALNAGVDGITGATTRKISMHTGDPGTTGANEVTGGSYAQVDSTFPSASGGSSAGSQVTINIPASTDVTHWGLWSGTTFYWGAALSATESFGSAGTLKHTPTVTLSNPS